MNRIEDCADQVAAVADFFDGLAVHTDRMPVSQIDVFSIEAEDDETRKEKAV